MLRLINFLVPKNRKMIYLRSHYEYRDNIHSILDELLLHSLEHKYSIVCDGIAFNNYSSNKLIKPKNRIMLFYYFLRSKYVFFDGGIYGQMSPIKRQILVNTWHGVSLKKIGYHIQGYNKNSNKRLATYLTVYSDFFVENMSKAFGVPKSDVLITGEPRNDQFFRTSFGESLKKINIEKNTYNKVIIWMPTYRKHKITKETDGNTYLYGIPFVSDLIQLNVLLKEYNVLLIVKLHGLEENSESLEYSNIRYITSIELGKSNLSVNELLVDCDALITDYSSVYINYLLLNRQICFAYDDMEEYKSNRGFMFKDVESIMPGFHAKNYSDIEKFIMKIVEDSDAYENIRNGVNSLLNKYTDGKNSLRILQFLNIISEDK